LQASNDQELFLTEEKMGAMRQQLWRSCVRGRGEQAKKTNKANVGWTGQAAGRVPQRRGRYGHGRRPGLRGRPGRAGPHQHGSILQKIHPTRGSRWLCHRQGKFLGVRNINFFHPGIVFWLHYRPRAQISNHRRALVTIVNFGEIFVFGLWTPKEQNFSFV
jgi:hypothetical protein